MKQKKPTRNEITELIKQFNSVFYALEKRIRGLEFVLSEYFKYSKTEEKFEKYLKRKDDEKRKNVEKSDAKANESHIQGGATNP